MEFEKKNTNGKGRIKGSQNKATKEVKEMFKQLLEDNLPDVQRQLDSMKAEAKFNALMQLAKFVIPTLKSQDFVIESNGFKPIQIILTNDKTDDNTD